MAAGVMLACLGGLGGAMLFQQATHANQVVVVQRSVARGDVVRASDLGVVTIGTAPGVRTLPAEALDELVGQQALVDLPQGSLVGDGLVGTSSVPEGHAVLGLKLAAGRVPVQPLPAGTQVQLVQVGEAKGGAAPQEQLVVLAQVVTAPREMADGSSQLLDVAVPGAAAQQVADLAARDLLVLVRKAK